LVTLSVYSSALPARAVGGPVFSMSIAGCWNAVARAVTSIAFRLLT
jgi:hypothetical protein